MAIFNPYRDKYGDSPVAMLEAHHVRAQMDDMVDTPAAASVWPHRLDHHPEPRHK